MDPTTLRLPADTLAELDSEYGDYGYGSRSDYIRAIIEDRDPPFADDATTSATTAGYDGQTMSDYEAPTTDDYERLRERVDELEARVDDLGTELNQQPTAEQGAVLVNDDTPALEVSATPSSASDPYGEHVQTALEIVRRADEHVPKRVILANVPDADIKEGSLWERHIQPALRESEAEHTRNKGWFADG